MGATYLFVINSFLAGGAERSLLEMLPRFAERDVTPVIACLRYRDVGFEEEVRSQGYDVRLLGGRGRLGKIRALRKLISEVRPQLVYTSLFDADLAGRLAAAGRGVPVVTNLANTAYDAARLADPNIDPWKLRVVRWVDGVTSRRLTAHFHAVSQAVKDSTVATLGVDPDRVTVVKRGRDPGRLGTPSEERRSTVRSEHGIAGDTELVVTVGRQEYQKGHRHLIEAFARVSTLRPRARLVIVGREGHSSVELRRLVDELGLGGSVTFLGHRSDVADLLAAADLFVFPSLYEGLGGALIEALALGLPIVASDIPAIREVVTPGVNADLVPVGDVAALAQSMAELLADRPRMQRYGAASRERFEAEFTLDVATDRLLDLLASVATGSPAPPDEAPPPTPDHDAVQVLGRMHEARGPLGAPGTWTVGRSWDSFKATFVEMTSDSGESIAVKFGTNWSDGDPAFVCAETRRVRSLLAGLQDGPVAMPDALGWTDEPPAVALELMPGEGLFDLLADGGHPVWASDGALAVALVRQCGRALGAFHSAQPGEASGDDGSGARGELRVAAKRSAVRRADLRAIADRLVTARSYRFSPNDFIVAGGDRLVMLDPPHVRKFDHVQRDISAFTFELHRHVVGERPASASAPRRRLEQLRTAFLDGYRSTGPTDLASTLDRWVLRLYETSRVTGHLYGKVRNRTVRGFPGTIAWALASRRLVGKPPAQDGE